MGEAEKCPKCGGEVVKSLAENLGIAFGCTRAEPKKSEDLPVGRVEPYYCRSCGYVEFYKKLS
jgi:predicted nucleic-acid-binding Zn-ribbon protein